MNEEKEIKVKVLDEISLEKLKQLIETAFKIKFTVTKKDKDIYYDLKDNFYFNLNHGLRIRNENELAYKALFYVPKRTKNPWFVLEKEYSLPISKEDILDLFKLANLRFDDVLRDKININELKSIFQKLNLFEHIKINKVRHIARNKDCEVCIDLVKELGLFVEIEANNDELLNHFKERLSFKYKEIRHGYTSLYAKEVIRVDVPDFKEIFLNNPGWNVLDGQKEYIQNK